MNQSQAASRVRTVPTASLMNISQRRSQRSAATPAIGSSRIPVIAPANGASAKRVAEPVVS